MDEALAFLHTLLDAEREAWQAYFGADRDRFHAALAAHNALSLPDLHDSYGIVPDREVMADPQAHAEMYSHVVYTPRNLLRVSHYQNEKYGDLFLALASNVNPNGECFGISDGLFVARVDGALKVVRRFSYDSSDDVPWIRGPGDRAVSFDTAGTLLEVRRLWAPNWDEADTAEYLRDF